MPKEMRNNLAGIGEFPKYSEAQLENTSRPGGGETTPAAASEAPSDLVHTGGAEHIASKTSGSDSGFARPGGNQGINA